MKRLPAVLRRGLIRLSYLLPVISGLILLIYAAVPHIYFLHENRVYQTLSSFDLVANTFETCSALLSDGAGADAGTIYFAYGMRIAVIVFWVVILLYAILAVAAALTSCLAFWGEPTARETNRAKRWMQFFCPNRATYVIGNLILLLASAFPDILLYFYQTQLGYTDMQLHFFGPGDLLLGGILIALNVLSFLLLLPAQAEEHLDMFRLYKAKQ